MTLPFLSIRRALGLAALLGFTTVAAASGPAIEGVLPSFDGASPWLNSQPLTPQGLRGKVVLIDFWTYSCINCLRSLPYVEAWYERYQDHGLVVIGVHAPEFDFEKSPDNVRHAVKDLGVTYPVVLDNDYAIWQRFNNQFWPAHYFIDAMGRIRGHHYGEGDYADSEKALRQLLTEAGYKDLPAAGSGIPPSHGIGAAADAAHVRSPETYVGYQRASGFSSPGGFSEDRAKTYATPPSLELNHWGLGGDWLVRGENGVLKTAPGTLSFRFYARDLHLVMGPGVDGKPVRFRVELDGATPGPDHGTDIAPDGSGVVREQRLYQLIRQSKEVKEHTFTIHFLDSGVQVYSFTFG